MEDYPKTIVGFESRFSSWLHKLRRAMLRPGRGRLSGRIEVDKTYIRGEKPGKRGRGALGKSLVVIAAEKEGKRIGRIRLVRVPDASAESLEEAIRHPHYVILNGQERVAGG